MDAEDLVDTAEMYLKAVLELEEEGTVAMRARLAERFGHSGPTVAQTVSRMQRDGLLMLDSERHLSFTPRGRAVASAVMRKHRLAEVFLQRVIDLDWEYIHQEACRWERVMSDRVAALLEDMLGSPDSTPYGSPVALGSEGDAGVAPLNLVRIASIPSRAAVTIVWIGEPLQADPRALASLRENDLLPGRRVRLALHGPSLLITVDGSDHDVELPVELAAHMFAVVDAPESASRSTK